MDIKSYTWVDTLKTSKLGSTSSSTTSKPGSTSSSTTSEPVPMTIAVITISVILGSSVLF